jgi:predicted small lipoprotein YifL
MLRASTANTSLKALLAAAVIFGLAACGQKPKEEYKTDVKDESGGQLIVEDATPGAVDVKIPDTPMTNIPEDTDQPSGD